MAEIIPNSTLRRLATETQCGERGNLEGAAAFAVMAPRAGRAEVARAAVAFQALYDYVDTLAEQPCGDPVRNGRLLHQALIAALDIEEPLTDFYAAGDDGGEGEYLNSMIASCRCALAALPSYPTVREPMRRAAARMVDYQCFIHARDDMTGLREWAESLTPPGSGLRWWETGAGAASSLGVFALLAAASRPGLQEREVAAIEAAYFPWIGALHVLLDSLVDHDADLRSGHLSLFAHYSDPAEAAVRLRAIAMQALAGASSMTAGEQHAAILAAMSSFYLCRSAATRKAALPARAAVIDALGSLARPTMAVLQARRATKTLANSGLQFVHPGT